MTISSTSRVAGPFNGTGSASNFPIMFAVFAATDVYVTTLNVATGATAVLALTTDYTVALNADQNGNPGGSITLTSGGQTGGVLAAGYRLAITTEMPAVQGLDLTNGGAFYPDVINAALDTLTILVQQLGVLAARSLQVPIVDSGAGVVLPPAAERVGNLLGFDGEGNVEMVAMAGGGGGSGGSIPVAQAAVGTVDGTNTAFTFTATATTPPVPMVYAGGVFQSPTADYDTPVTLVSGNTWQLTFVTAPAVGPITVVLFA